MTKIATHSTRSSHHSSARNGTSDLRSLISDARSTLSNASSHAAENVAAVRDRIAGTVSNMRERGRVIAKGARRQAKRADAKIRANPYPAIGIAAAAGVVAGLVIARRRNSR
jgi:ElaB/YqjD/DUF883 family membrane-anchored ribosome-binding protein